MILRPPTRSTFSYPEGDCIFTGIPYGSRAYAYGRNWDCVKRGTYDFSALCPCCDCYLDYVHKFTRLQAICRMLSIRNKL